MNFDCPYCNHPTTVTIPNIDTTWSVIDIAEAHLEYEDRVGIEYRAVACPNKDCKKLSLRVRLTEAERNYGSWEAAEELQRWQLLPESEAKPQPEYIPRALVEDYTEACLIKNLSPKASATLARRCLQGMIRDFWKIRKGTLELEINALKDNLSIDDWNAINAIRKVGNIGAHMKKDVDIIVGIEPNEAELLINLVEDLFLDWYVARHDKQERQRQITDLAESKKSTNRTSKSAGS